VKKCHYRRLFLCCHTQRIHSMLNYTQRLYVVLGHLVALFKVTHQWINSYCCISMHGKRTLAERDTQLVSLTAILMFTVTPLMIDEPQQTLRPREPRRRGVRGLLAEFVAVTRQTRHHRCNWRLLRLPCCRAPSPTLTTQSGEMARYRAQFTWAVISLSLGEGEIRGWQLNEVNNVLENLFWGNWWREARLAR